MAKEFLEKLKNAVDNGEFNSEAAKKIKDIDKLADEKKNAEKLIEKRLEEAGVVKLVTEEAIELNSDYEKKMEEIKKQDAINRQLATLIEVEDMVKASIEDMLSFAQELEQKFEKEFEAEDPMFGDLSLKIEEVKNKYEPTLIQYAQKYAHKKI
jgi:hypothetical protein